MAGAFIQGAGFSTPSSTTGVATFGSATISGHQIIVIAGSFAGTPHAITSVTDDGGNTYVRKLTSLSDSSSFQDVDVWQAENANSATNVTVHYGGSSNAVGLAIEVSGLVVSSSLDKTATANGFSGSGGSIATSSVTTTSAREYLLGLVWFDSIGGVSLTPGSGYTSRFNFQDNTNFSVQFFVMDQNVTSTGSYAATGTHTGNTDFLTAFLTLVEPSTGAFKSGVENGGTGSSLTLALTGVAVGDTIIVVGGVVNDSSTTITSVQDDHGNTYTRKVTGIQTGAGGFILENGELWVTTVAAVGVGGAVNVQINYSGSTTGNTIGYAIDYSSGIVGVDVSNTNHGTVIGSGSVTAGGATTTNANDLLVGIVWTFSGGSPTLTPGSGYTLEQSVTDVNTGTKFWLQDKTINATGSVDSDGSLNATAAYSDTLVAFKLSAGGTDVSLTHNADMFVLGGANSITYNCDMFVSTDPTIVQHTSQCVALNNEIDLSLFGVTAGNTFIVIISYSVTTVAGNPFTVADSGFSETFTKQHGPDNDSGASDFGSQIWTAPILTGGFKTVSIKLPTSPSLIQAPFCAALIEAQGLDNADLFDKWAGQFGGPDKNLNSGSTATTVRASELLIGYGGTEDNIDSNLALTPNGSFDTVEAQVAGQQALIVQEQSVSALGSYLAAATAQTSSPFPWGMSIATFKKGASVQTDVSYNNDMFVAFPPSLSYNCDMFVFAPRNLTYSCDMFIDTVFTARGFVQVAGTILFPIDPNAFIKVHATVAQNIRNFLSIFGTVVSSGNRSFLNVIGQIQIRNRNFVNVRGNISNDKLLTFSCDMCIAAPNNLQFVGVLGTIVGKPQIGKCGGFPDETFINVAGWIVEPPALNDSLQMPNQGFTRDFDWNSSADALARYKPGSLFKLSGGTLPPGGVALIITAFSCGVASFQTRTRSWLRRVDEATSGILTTQRVRTETLPNGAVITTTTVVTQNQDTTITKTTVTNSATPERISTQITTKNQSGQTVTREIDTTTINGIVSSQEKKLVTTSPPTNDNIQPLQVRTLDGILHYQFFSKENTEWAGGDQEGLTTIDKQVQIVPGTLNGETQDQFGNLIYNQRTTTTETDPTGKTVLTVTEEIGTRKDIGTTTVDTQQQFNGIQTKTTKTTNYPDGSQDVTVTTSNPLTGDTVEVDTETTTDEFGQVTVTTTRTETVTATVNGTPTQVTTKTVTVNKGGVQTVDTVIETTNDFEDDIVADKIKVYSIQEFTLTCTIDEFNKTALEEVNFTHQRNYALLELLGQQLGNANLSYGLRQTLIEQFNIANACIAPITLQALGRVWRVVFAQSASAFRAKYIPGVEPPVYELQMILQARSDLTNGQFGG